jgi:hypothetical protein
VDEEVLELVLVLDAVLVLVDDSEDVAVLEDVLESGTW